jgi:hypothetical protein
VSNFCKLSVFDFFCETIVKILTLVPWRISILGLPT